MPYFLVILQGTLRITLILWWDLISWLFKSSVEFRCTVLWSDWMFMFIHFRERKDNLENSLGWQMWPIVTQGYWNPKNTDVLRRWLLLIQTGWWCFPPKQAGKAAAQMKISWYKGLLNAMGFLQCQEGMVLSRWCGWRDRNLCFQCKDYSTLFSLKCCASNFLL